MKSIHIRPARAGDQRAIRMIVRAARLNPLGLAWQDFIVAEHAGGLAAIGQVRPHRDGTRELASIAVVPEWQGLGLGQAIVQALLAREAGPLYLMCASATMPFYLRFGFAELDLPAMPGHYRRLARLARLFGRLRPGHGGYLAVMRRAPH